MAGADLLARFANQYRPQINYGIDPFLKFDKNCYHARPYFTVECSLVQDLFVFIGSFAVELLNTSQSLSLSPARKELSTQDLGYNPLCE